MVRRTFASDGMKKVDTSKGTSNDWVDTISGTLQTNASVASAVGEDVTLAHFDKCKFNVITVSEEVCINT